MLFIKQIRHNHCEKNEREKGEQQIFDFVNTTNAAVVGVARARSLPQHK